MKIELLLLVTSNVTMAVPRFLLIFPLFIVNTNCFLSSPGSTFHSLQHACQSLKKELTNLRDQSTPPFGFKSYDTDILALKSTSSGDLLSNSDNPSKKNDTNHLTTSNNNSTGTTKLLKKTKIIRRIRRKEAKELERVFVPPRGSSIYLPETWEHVRPIASDEEIKDDEWPLDMKILNIEMAINKAVKEQKYSAADKIQKELTFSQIDDTSNVLSRHLEFYEALSTKRADLMAPIWLRSNKITCDHPTPGFNGISGGTTVVGYSAVMRGWVNAFAVADEQFRMGTIKAKNIIVQCRGSMAFVTATEEIQAPPVRGRPSSVGAAMASFLGDKASQVPGGRAAGEGSVLDGYTLQFSSVCAYKKYRGHWFQVHYQGFALHLAAASLQGDMQRREDGQAAGDGAEAGGDGAINLGQNSAMVLGDGKLLKGPMLVRGNVSPDELKKILEGKGLGGTIIGGSSGPGGGGGGGLGGGRLGRPSLEEILNMDDDDDDDDEDDEDEDDEDDIIEEDYDEVMDSVDMDRRRRRENNNSNNNNKISNGSSGGSGRLVDAIQKEGRGRDSNDKSATTTTSSSPDPSPGQGSLESDGRDYTRETVNVIRRLSKDGLISTVEKRLLVADIIQQATREDPSPVQIAYELLLSDTENVRQTTKTIKNANTNTDMDKSDTTTSTEGGGVIDLGVSAGGGSLELSYDEDDLLEFADQCKLFAARLAGGNQQQQ